MYFRVRCIDRLPAWIALMVVLTGAGRAQEVVFPPVPLVGKSAKAESPSDMILQMTAARRALETGLSSVAVELYQGFLDAPSLDGELRNRVVVDMATALLDDDRLKEAEQVLGRYVGLPSPEYRLKVAMLAARAKKFDAARNEIATLKAEDIPAAERGWYYHLLGLLADAVQDRKAAGYYQQAIDSATSSIQRTRFLLAHERAKLLLGEASEAQANTQRQALERYEGTISGYTAVSQLAVTYNALNRKAEAVALLEGKLQVLPREEALIADQWRLLLGLIAGAESGAGRTALRSLLSNAQDSDKQRVALQMLEQASRSGTQREDFRKKLDDLIGQSTPHPILEDLLLFRAMVALSDKNYVRVDADADRLLELFPGSRLKVHVHGLLAQAAWEQGRFRNAASQAARARDEAGPREEIRRQLGVVVAEAYFRARDFRNAADAYASALLDVPGGVSAGDLIFQRVLAEIEAGRLTGKLDEAQSVLDEESRDSRFDLVNRWQCEWNIGRALQAAGQTAQAYARVNRLLENFPSSGGLSADLRARLAWLQSRLAFETGDYKRTLSLTATLLGTLSGVDATLRSDIGSTTLLLQAEAVLQMNESGRASGGLELLKKLRTEFPKTDAAVYSYIVEADWNAKNNQIVAAQQLLIKLSDEYRDHVNAPYALYQAALYAERRGDQYYPEAYKLLENLVKSHGSSDLVFYARLKQGNLLRLLNQYPQAQQIYEDLANKYPQHKDVFAAQLALANCHAAQAAADSSHLESASTIFERLFDRPDASADLRIEAGFNWGLNLAQRNQGKRAEAIWWSVVNTFLLDEAKAAELGTNGRYWLSKTLINMGELLEKQAKLEQAQEAYNLILRKGLPGAALAQERLARFKSRSVAKPGA